MHTLYPLVDAQLWLRWLLAFTLLLGVPGYLMVGRRLSDLDPLSRVVASFACGVLLVPLVGVIFWWVGIPLRLGSFGVAVLILVLALDRLPAHRAAVASWTRGVRPLQGSEQLGLLGCGLLMALLMLRGLGDLPAPPHVIDSSNHAFLVLRVFETGSLDPTVLFAEVGNRTLSYLAGWHAVAAMLAGLSGIAPYISTWFLPSLLVCLLPVSLSLVWRAWQLPGPAILVGGLAVAVNQLAPSGILGWGGFGQIIGLFLVPGVVVVTRSCLVHPSRYQGLIVGSLLALLVQVHASEVITVLILTGLSWLLLPGEERQSHSAHLQAMLVGIVPFVILCGPDFLANAEAYLHNVSGRELSATQAFGRAWDRYLETAGKSGGFKVLTFVGIGLALFHRSWRWIAFFSLALGALYVSLSSFADPVSRWLTLPYYRVADRINYLQLFLLPPVLAVPLLRLWLWIAERWQPRLGSLLCTVLLLGAVVPAVPGLLVNYRNMHATVPFTVAEYHLANEIPSVVDPEGRIANFWFDGSTWTMHVAGYPFLLPCSWVVLDESGRDLRDYALGLVTEPWGAEAEQVRARGIDYIYVSDTRWSVLDTLPYRQADFDADTRFERVLWRENAALYRILWPND